MMKLTDYLQFIDTEIANEAFQHSIDLNTFQDKYLTLTRNCSNRVVKGSLHNKELLGLSVYWYQHQESHDEPPINEKLAKKAYEYANNENSDCPFDDFLGSYLFLQKCNVGVHSDIDLFKLATNINQNLDKMIHNELTHNQREYLQAFYDNKDFKRYFERYYKHKVQQWKEEINNGNDLSKS